MRLGETIKSHRKKSGWTLTELSDLCEISVAQLSKLENNKSNPSIESLQKLAEAFHVPVSALTLTTEVPPPHQLCAVKGMSYVCWHAVRKMSLPVIWSRIRGLGCSRWY